MEELKRLENENKALRQKVARLEAKIEELNDEIATLEEVVEREVDCDGDMDEDR